MDCRATGRCRATPSFQVGQSYEARLFSDSNNTTLLTTSNPFTVAQAPSNNYYDATVTGTTSGSVWGTDIYTNDSTLGAVAVHMGIAAPGQTKTVRVYQLPGQSSYTGSTRNGVTTYSYGSWGASISMELVGGSGATPYNPDISIDLPSPPQVTVNDTFLISATVSDGNGDLGRAVLAWNGTTLLDRYHANSSLDQLAVYANAGSPAGSKNIQVWASDSRNPFGTPGNPGYSVLDRAVNVIVPNEAPHAFGLSVNVVSPAQIVFQGHASDADGNLSRFDFYVSEPPSYGGCLLRASATVSGSDVTANATWSPSSALLGGTYYARLIARDGAGASSTETVEAAFTVAGSQTIDFPAIPNKSGASPPFAVTATTSSGLPVTFTLVSGPATLNGSTVTLTGYGQVTIRADQAGNATFLPAPPVSRSFNVTLGSTTDSDGDGMPDEWETIYGYNPNSSADAAQDADGDGVSNLLEYRLGTSPRAVHVNDGTNQLLKVYSPKN